VSSAFGLVSPPRQSAYGASKFAVRGFTEALSAELRPNGIGVTSIHPGGTRTNLPDHTGAGAGVPGPEARAELTAFRRILTMDPDHVAEKALTAIEHRRPRVVIGFTGKAPDLLSRVLPGTYTRVMAVGEQVLGWGSSQWLRRRGTR
jgi:short-subunit dehydrogenase